MLKRKPKKRRTPNPLKVSTRSAVKKGPWRSPEHRAFVRSYPCVLCGATGANHAHHIRERFPRTMGLRIGDQWCISLCEQHHTELHKSSRTFWEKYPIGPEA